MVLGLAADQDRILVSHDFHTMPRHFADFAQARGSSPGVFLIPQCLPVREAIEELVLIWGRVELRGVGRPHSRKFRYLKAF